MLTAQDISKIKGLVATKTDVTRLEKKISTKIEQDIFALTSRLVAVVATKEDVKRLEHRIDLLDEKFDKQLVLLDKLIAKVDAMTLEYAAVSTQLSRHEEWIKKLAEKAGVKLEY
jgi:hypothetical protein